MSKAYSYYQDQLRTLADLEGAIAGLSWDKEVIMPSKGHPYRSRQIATLAGMAHELKTDPKLVATIDELYQQRADLSEAEAANVLRSWEDQRRSLKLDKDFVMRQSQAISQGYEAWLKAREQNDFSLFEPALATLVALKREEAERIGYEEHPYDALLEEYEPGMTCAQLDPIFAGVREHLTPFAAKVRAAESPDDGFLVGSFDWQKQWDFGLQLLREMGYDFEAGRQDTSPHPFTINISPGDVRVTTVVDTQDFQTMTWSCLHEGGHALYEQGLPADDYGLPRSRAASLGIHESQSRLWENHVGRSRDYWQYYYPVLQSIFPDQLQDISLDAFYRAINKVQPGLIRTQADELHYHFHVLIRYELEKGLVEGSLNTSELKEAWNEAYERYLGVEVPDDRQGVLQDIHWAHGSIGYFPTYSLGSFYAAQFYAQAQQEIPDLQENIRKGDSSALLSWLRKKVHQHGRQYLAPELCRRITGEPLSYEPFREYVERKYGTLYGF
jgi:carboxypeptidase Taq